MAQTHDRDTVIEEIHRTRREISEKFGGDIVAMLDDARKRQAASGRPVWRRDLPNVATPPSKGGAESASDT